MSIGGLEMRLSTPSTHPTLTAASIVLAFILLAGTVSPVTVNASIPKFTLTVTCDGSGTVMRDPLFTQYLAGTNVTLTAIPAPGWSFTGWSGDLSDATNPGNIIMDGDKTVTAIFTHDEYTLTTAILPNDGGEISIVPLQETYHYGDIVQLTAEPNLGWSFDHWSNSQEEASIQITIIDNTDISAIFSQDQYTLTVNIVGHGTVTQDPDKETYTYGETVNLTAIPDSGWIFSHWSKAALSVTDILSVTITEDTEITATFTQRASGSTGSPPTAKANGPYHGLLGSPLTFSAEGSHDNDEYGNRIIRYDWKFSADGPWTTLSASPVYTYQQAGNFTVTLRVTDDEGQTATDTTYAIIASANYPPTMPILNGPTQGTINTRYNFTVSSTDPENMTLSYTMDWGDGTWDVMQNQASGATAGFSHIWTHPGPWILTITVSDPFTQTSTSTRMLIDTIAITTIGYLIDENHDGLYDLFETPAGVQTSVNRYTSTLYLLDVNADGLWDYTYNSENHELTPYQAAMGLAPEVILVWSLVIAVLLAVTLLFILADRRRKKPNNQP
jgi:uncharacterized repeat protein (TIGR02543 family)